MVELLWNGLLLSKTGQLSCDVKYLRRQQSFISEWFVTVLERGLIRMKYSIMQTAIDCFIGLAGLKYSFVFNFGK
jgi:hypothetical protein